MILQASLKEKKKRWSTDLGLFSELVEEDKVVYNQIPVNTLKEHMEKLKDGFFKKGVSFQVTREKLKLIDFFEIVVNWQNSQTKNLINMTTIILYLIVAKLIDILEILNE